MGTLLYAKGVFINRCYDELNLSQPELIRGIHADYLAAVRYVDDFVGRLVAAGDERDRRRLGARSRPDRQAQ